MTQHTAGQDGSSAVSSAGTWRLQRARGAAPRLLDALGGQRHAAPVPGREPVTRLVRLCEVTRPALVLGSTQPSADVDHEIAASLGVDVCRRASGGGAVLVAPEAQLWVDVLVPTGDRLWTSDASQAFLWLGEAFASAVRSATGRAGSVHRGAMQRTRWSSKLCFAGLGPGEVLVGGRKVVGISQRRDKQAASFHAMALLRFDAASSVAALALDHRARREAIAELEEGVAALTVDAGALESALLGVLAGLP